QIGGREGNPIHGSRRGHAIAQIAVAPAVLNGRARTGAKHVQASLHLRSHLSIRGGCKTLRLQPPCSWHRTPQDRSVRSKARRLCEEEKSGRAGDRTS